MNMLQPIAQANPQWDLETFVQVANDLLPHYLPSVDPNRSHTPEAINLRLVRYYTTQGVLDRPLRQGREARYTYRQLLQVLVVRRLLGEGYSTSALQPITIEKSNTDLEALLQGGMQLTIETANPALAFLQSVQTRTPDASAAMPVQSPAAPAPRDLALQDSSAPSRWQRIVVLPGLEIHIKEDFVSPSTPQERENLLQLIAQRLSSLFHPKRSSP